MNALGVIRNMMKKGLDKSLKELYYTGTVKGGRFVGKDQFGNEYYEDLEDLYGRNRYILFADPANDCPTNIPPEWHSWACQMKDTPPSVSEIVERQFFESDYTPNPTGTNDAYTPTNSRDTNGEAKMSTWSPDAPKVEPKDYPAHF